jgi:hypothetical protein
LGFLAKNPEPNNALRKREENNQMRIINNNTVTITLELTEDELAVVMQGVWIVEGRGDDCFGMQTLAKELLQQLDENIAQTEQRYALLTDLFTGKLKEKVMDK